jgi:hypothetical protein
LIGCRREALNRILEIHDMPMIRHTRRRTELLSYEVFGPKAYPTESALCTLCLLHPNRGNWIVRNPKIVDLPTMGEQSTEAAASGIRPDPSFPWR